MLPLMYNNTYQIVQSKDEVAIDVEMVHDVRHIRLTDKHGPSQIKLWMGDSIGHWEGDTLVVETVNMRPEQGLRGGSPNQKVTERFTRIGPNKLKYAFTVEDPSTYVEPFSGEVAMNATKGQVYEYACHEGNYALTGMLATRLPEPRKPRARRPLRQAMAAEPSDASRSRWIMRAGEKGFRDRRRPSSSPADLNVELQPDGHRV